MKPQDNLEKLIKKIRYKPTAETHNRILNNTLRALDESEKTTSAPRPNIWRIIMKSKITKLAVAAVIIIAMLVCLNQFIGLSNPAERHINIVEVLDGPQTYQFKDGSSVNLSKGARISLYGNRKKRGFGHITGEIEVAVASGEGEFIVTTSLGEVKALGTVFQMDIVTVDSTELLAVKVEEGVVEVSNAKGSKIIRENQRLTVEKGKAPYDFQQDENLPPRLIERIQTMLDAVEKGDKRAWLANFNINSFYDLAKGKVEYEQHPDWFSGMSPDDANRFRQALANVNSLEEIKEIMLADISDNIYKLYVRLVTLSEDGKHAKAVCVRKLDQAVGFTPQWTFFDDDWWQTDD